MKRTNIFFRLPLVILLTVFFYNSCKKPGNNITWVVNTAVNKSPVVIRFVNANINSTTQLPGSFKVQISGQGAGQVVMESGGTDFEVQNGFLPLALLPTANASLANPVVFNVYASIAGFAPISQTFVVTDTLPVNHVLYAVEYANAPDGTSAIIDNYPLTGGTSANNTVITMPATGSLTETSTITILPGTQMLDSSGSLISSANSLNARVVNFGTETQSSLSSFPGGFNPVDVVYNGQPQQNVTFKTGGFLSINMVAGGKTVKNFSQPISISAELNSALINPTTNTNIAVGDTIPIWSMNEQTGEWRYESTATVAMDANNKLSVQFQASHLSCWNIDWWCKPCGSTLTVTVHIPSPAGFKPQYELALVDANGQYLGGLYTDATWGTVATLYDGLVTVIPRLPNIPQARLAVYSRRGDPTSLIAQTALFNPCSQGTVDITINPPTPPQLVNVTLNVKGKCTNKKVVATVNAWVYLYKQNDVWWNWILVPIIDGQANVQLQQGTEYFVATYYSGDWFTTQGTFNKNDTNFPAEHGLEGTATYNATTNTVTANLTFPISCN